MLGADPEAGSVRPQPEPRCGPGCRGGLPSLPGTVRARLRLQPPPAHPGQRAAHQARCMLLANSAFHWTSLCKFCVTQDNVLHIKQGVCCLSLSPVEFLHLHTCVTQDIVLRTACFALALSVQFLSYPRIACCTSSKVHAAC